MPMPPNEYIAALIIKHLRGELSPGEETALQDWMAKSENNRRIAESFLDEHKLDQAILDHWVKERIWTRLEAGIEETPVIPIWRRTGWRMAAAATILLAIAGIYLLRS